MKFLFLFLAILTSPQYWEESDVVRGLRSHVTEITLSQNDGRAPGSEGEAAVAAYVYETLAAAGVDMLCPPEGDVFGLRGPQGDTLVSRNVMGFIHGYDKTLRDHFVVIGARMDNLGVNTLTVDGVPVSQVYTGANGNASGLALMLEVAKVLQKRSVLLRRSVLFVGFGSSTHSFAGAWHFLHQSFARDAANIDAMINLDAVGVDRDGLMAFTSGNEDINRMLSDFGSGPIPIRPKIVPMEPYPSDHQVFYASEIPSVLFTTGRYPEHNTPKDMPSLLDYEFMEREVETVASFAIELANAPEGVPSFRYMPKDKGMVDDENVYSWSDCEVPPTFMHNPHPIFFLEKWVYPYLKYPQNCIRDGIQGRVMVEFIIDRKGKVRDVHVVKSVDPELDAAAVKVVAASPDWKPGRMHGKKVDCSMTIPVEFKLKKRK